jgi:uncharacterized protein YjiS (DUF1127 family)
MSAIDTILEGGTRAYSPVWSQFAKVFRILQARYLTWRELQRSRLHLFELSDAELMDIGLTREIAKREASRSLMACYLNNSR